MHDSTQRFNGRAEDYNRFRERYPADSILTVLRNWGVLTSLSVVADVGAGTGMLAEVFLKNGNPVIAIEPNREMRAYAEQLRKRWPDLRTVDATAEQTTLPDSCTDIVAAGRAFHWFDRDRALAKFRRILRPDGWVVLVSLGRAHHGSTPEDAARIDAFERLLVEHGTDYNYIREGYRIHEHLRELFPVHAAFHQQQIPGTQRLDWEALRGQVMSLSVAPQPDHPNHSTFQRELRVLFETYQTGGEVTIPTTCWITAAQLAAADTLVLTP